MGKTRKLFLPTLMIALLLIGCDPPVTPVPTLTLRPGTLMTITPGLTDTPIPTLTIRAETVAVVKENTYCLSGNNENVTKTAINQFQMVMVLGKNTTGDWILVRLEGFPDCWVDLYSLNVECDLSLLPIETPSLDLYAQNDSKDFYVVSTVEIVECACGEYFGKAIVKLEFKNGVSPYSVNDQSPVFSDSVTFDSPLGVSITLRVVSYDGKEWNGVVEVPWCFQPNSGCQVLSTPLSNTSVPPTPPTPPTITPCYVPPAPSNLTSQPSGGNNFNLSWSAVSGATRYQVHRSDGAVSDTTGTRITVEVKNNHSFTFYVTAFNNCGESLPSNPVTISR